jgi:hypothetical protein
MLSQAPESILMIRPDNFGYNPATAQSNTFQRADLSQSPDEISKEAQREFDHLVNILLNSNINVIVFEDQADQKLSDAVFPNNWISFHHDGTVVLYPMQAENRRKERRQDILLNLQSKYDFQIVKILDYSDFEQHGRFLEGTGSIVFDYKNKIAYANASPRTDEIVLDKLCNDLGFEKFLFTAVDSNGRDIYHTNVFMCVGDKFVVVCLDTIPDKAMKERMLLSFERTGHEVVDISYDQLKQFAGNMIEVLNSEGKPNLIMSQSACDSLKKAQRQKLESHAEILYAPIPMIEKYGGGSVRCMIAGNFLPRL